MRTVLVFGLAAWLLAGASLASPVSERDSLRRFSYREIHMGVEVRLLLYAPDTARARSAARAAFGRIAHLNRILSSYLSSSDLSRLNGAAGDGARRVPQELFYVLWRSVEIAERTGGAFEPTIGPLSDLWAEARTTGRLPARAARARADSLVGWQLLELDPVERTARLPRAGMALDLGGIAKGYVLDEALDELRLEGIDRALVDAGGDIVVGAPPPRQDPDSTAPASNTSLSDSFRARGWTVETPSGRTLTLSHAAVATSGDSQQFVEIGGTRYSHIVDPRTGLGLTHRTAVTVVAPTGLAADAYATALSVMGPEDGRRFAALRPGFRAYFYAPNETAEEESDAPDR